MENIHPKVQRPTTYADNRRLYALIVVMIIMVAALVYLSMLFGIKNDKWVCKDGVWVEQGNPTESMPLYPCE